KYITHRTTDIRHLTSYRTNHLFTAPMSARDVSVSALWAVIDRPYSGWSGPRGSLPPLLRSRMKRVGNVIGLFKPVGDRGLDLVTMCDTDLMPEFDGGCGNDLAYA